MSEHTPTPWRTLTPDVHNRQITVVAADCSVAACRWNNDGRAKTVVENDAAFIVRAANSHDALAQALKGLTDVVSACMADAGDDGSLIVRDQLAKARAALKLVDNVDLAR